MKKMQFLIWLMTVHADLSLCLGLYVDGEMETRLTWNSFHWRLAYDPENSLTKRQRRSSAAVSRRCITWDPIAHARRSDCVKQHILL